MAKVTVYTLDYCPYCKKANRLLNENNIEFEEIEISDNEMAMRKKLGEMTGGQTTVPQIFINDKSIGGSTELQELISSGKIKDLL